MPTRSSSPGPLPLRWALILTASVVMALLVGGLAFAQTVSWPAAILAGLAAAGSAIPALHRVLGR